MSEKSVLEWCFSNFSMLTNYLEIVKMQLLIM